MGVPLALQLQPVESMLQWTPLAVDPDPLEDDECEPQAPTLRTAARVTKRASRLRRCFMGGVPIATRVPSYETLIREECRSGSLPKVRRNGHERRRFVVVVVAERALRALRARTRAASCGGLRA